MNDPDRIEPRRRGGQTQPQYHAQLEGREAKFAHLVLTGCLSVPLGAMFMFLMKGYGPEWLAGAIGLLVGAACAAGCWLLLKHDRPRPRPMLLTTAVIVALLGVGFIALGVLLGGAALLSGGSFGILCVFAAAGIWKRGRAARGQEPA